VAQPAAADVCAVERGGQIDGELSQTDKKGWHGRERTSEGGPAGQPDALHSAHR